MERGVDVGEGRVVVTREAALGNERGWGEGGDAGEGTDSRIGPMRQSKMSFFFFLNLPIQNVTKPFHGVFFFFPFRMYFSACVSLLACNLALVILDLC